MTATPKNSPGLTSGDLKNAPQSEQSPATQDVRLETLRILSHSIVREVESLTREKSLMREKSRYLLVKINLASEVRDYEASLIRCALIRTGGNQRQAANLLGIKTTTLSAKINRYQLTPGGLISREQNVNPPGGSGDD